jgi:6-pyruvoyl-tetrahydropterin synthase related domain
METQLKPMEREATRTPEPDCSHPLLLMIVLAGVAALLVVSPFFFLGNASGHDFEFHLASWMDVARQWHEGVVYPRWAELANWGFGEPRFIFYPPASWLLGAALRLVFPWRMVPGVFIWLALTFAGVTMYRLAREWLPARTAVLAGLLFAINPYHLVMVYWRSDFAELLASALIPLAVLFSMRAATGYRRGLVPLAMIIAAIWLCNAPAAVVVTYTVALIVAVIAIVDRNPRPLLSGGGALALGLALAGFYIVPAAWEQPWVNISEALSPGLRFSENFLFTRTADVEHMRFNFIVSWIAVEVMVATLVAIIAAGRWRRQPPRLRWIMLAMTVISAVLMLPSTSPLWSYVPKLRYVQFPWRWLLVLAVPCAVFLATAVERLRGQTQRAVWALALTGLALTGFLLTRSNWWDSGGADDFYETHFSTGAGYLGTDEYAPRGSDHYDLDQKAPLVSLQRSETAVAQPGWSVDVQHWGPMRKDFVVHSASPVTAALRLLYYPAWRVTVNGHLVPVFSDQHTAQMLVPIASGGSHVEARWVATRDQLWGQAVSVTAALALLAILWASRQRSSALPASLR